MCLSMKIIGDQSTLMEILGIIIGLIGIVMVGVNYPIYKKMLENTIISICNKIKEQEYE